MNIGRKISEARTQKGWTQQQLSDASGISLRTIQRIEKDQVTPQFHTIGKIEEVMGVQVQKGKVSDTVILRMGITSVLLFIPFLSNVLIPWLILLLSKPNPTTKKIGGSFLMLQIILSVFFVVMEMVIFNVSQFIWGESNPGNFSPLTMGLIVYWLINLVIVITIFFQSKESNHRLLNRIPSLF